jgi:hypothetical protein
MAAILAAVLCLGLIGLYPQAFAAFSTESAEKIIGVGRIQSTPTTAPPASPTSRFAAPKLSSADEQANVNKLAQPLERTLEDAEKTAAIANDIKRFGEPDAAGWFTTKASAYGPSSAGQWTALGTELTLTSTDIGIDIDYADLLGRTIEIRYNGTVVRTRIVDVGNITDPERLFDLQPGLCTAFGAPTPEFGWGVRTIQWRFVD